MKREEMLKKFDKLADFYYANKIQIDTNHEGSYVLLYEMDVAGYFPTWDKAEIYALRHKMPDGLFLIHKCDLNEKPIFMANFAECF